MKILGIDTSSEVLSIALSDDREVIVEENHKLDRRHSSLLVPKIKEMLKGVGLSIDSVEAFVIGLGPGSFTGLRIGVSTVKGLGIAKKRPCIGVPSIDALALNVDKGPDIIVPLIDAKRQQVYSAIYKKEGDRIVRKSKYLLLTVDKLINKIKQSSVFLGDGLVLYRAKLEALNKNPVFLDKTYWYPRASNLIRLAGRYKKTDLSKLRPMYLYPKDCQVKR